VTRTELQYDRRQFEARITPLYDDRGDSLGLTALVHDPTEQKTRESRLQRRNRQLDQFASVVSDDLRNPLSVASGSLELAEQTGERDHFARTRRAHGRMRDLIDQVLALARDEEKLEMVQIVCNRDQLLQLFENAFRNSIEHGATGNRTAPDDGPGCTVTGSPATEAPDRACRSIDSVSRTMAREFPRPIANRCSTAATPPRRIEQGLA